MYITISEVPLSLLLLYTLYCIMCVSCMCVMLCRVLVIAPHLGITMDRISSTSFHRR